LKLVEGEVGRTDTTPAARSVESHGAESGAATVSGNSNAGHQTATDRLRSSVRKLAFMESAKLFSLALHLTGASQSDIAAAVDVSTTKVGKWVRGEATIPADAVRILLRRLPPVGVEILYLCAADLSTDVLALLVQRLNQLLSQRREVKSCTRF
jgi:hypothetical protein